MTKEAFTNLCHSYCLLQNEDNSKLLQSILKIVGIYYNDQLKTFTSQAETYNGIESEDTFRNKESKWLEYKAQSRITPLPLSSYDVECIDEILNTPQYGSLIAAISPLFECIGWETSKAGDVWRIKFVGSGTRDFWRDYPKIFEEKTDWKHPYGEDEEYDELIAEITNGGSMWDWKHGDFEDHITQQQIEGVNWKDGQDFN